jgi:hypothetical protein
MKNAALLSERGVFVGARCGALPLLALRVIHQCFVASASVSLRVIRHCLSAGS